MKLLYAMPGAGCETERNGLRTVGGHHVEGMWWSNLAPGFKGKGSGPKELISLVLIWIHVKLGYTTAPNQVKFLKQLHPPLNVKKQV